MLKVLKTRPKHCRHYPSSSGAFDRPEIVAQAFGGGARKKLIATRRGDTKTTVAEQERKMNEEFFVPDRVLIFPVSREETRVIIFE